MNHHHSSPTITNCVFIQNTVGDAFGRNGGAIINQDLSDTLLINCLFAFNSAWRGGAVFNSSISFPTAINCTFVGNSAVEEGTVIRNGTQDGMTIINSILWDNSNGAIFGGETEISYSDVEGGFPGTGNIDSDPLFVDAENGDFHLQAGSPCIDIGDNSVVTVPTDLDGNPRIAFASCNFAGTVDMGAYESQTFPSDQDGDGIPNESDNCPCYPNPTQDYNRADFDEDCDVDGVDFSVFASCFNKAGNPPRSLGCPQN